MPPRQCVVLATIYIALGCLPAALGWCHNVTAGVRGGSAGDAGQGFLRLRNKTPVPHTLWACHSPIHGRNIVIRRLEGTDNSDLISVYDTPDWWTIGNGVALVDLDLDAELPRKLVGYLRDDKKVQFERANDSIVADGRDFDKPQHDDPLAWKDLVDSPVPEFLAAESL
ncbi:unnamed protein product [Vitrella brassicaformis CCMP3155]|uniref:Uncharacterized protein n=2 Tax=Vitrella brassicaformis TaxID=1169539 RepID=A0A0G4F513_VITBC|nr:unnamed protein product [Vitrella brassicaformis CCMP3155]|eukprot:CEM07032.1 unnamed protein product [Vitrella brassicaformis CCMP3155]